MSDPQALHAELLAKISTEWEVWAPSPAAEPLGQIRIAAREVLELHKPVGHDLWSSQGKRLGWQCEECASRCHSGSGLSCDQPLDAEYPCETVKVISAALGVTTDG